MRKYSAISKIGIICSAVAILISGFTVLYDIKNGLKGTSVAFFFCTVAILFSNIAIAEGARKRKSKGKKEINMRAEE